MGAVDDGGAVGDTGAVDDGGDREQHEGVEGDEGTDELEPSLLDVVIFGPIDAAFSLCATREAPHCAAARAWTRRCDRHARSASSPCGSASASCAVAPRARARPRRRRPAVSAKAARRRTRPRRRDRRLRRAVGVPDRADARGPRPRRAGAGRRLRAASPRATDDPAQDRASSTGPVTDLAVRLASIDDAERRRAPPRRRARAPPNAAGRPRAPRAPRRAGRDRRAVARARPSAANALSARPTASWRSLDGVVVGLAVLTRTRGRRPRRRPHRARAATPADRHGAARGGEGARRAAGGPLRGARAAGGSDGEVAARGRGLQGPAAQDERRPLSAGRFCGRRRRRRRDAHPEQLGEGRHVPGGAHGRGLGLFCRGDARGVHGAAHRRGDDRVEHRDPRRRR